MKDFIYHQTLIFRKKKRLFPKGFSSFSSRSTSTFPFYRPILLFFSWIEAKCLTLFGFSSLCLWFLNQYWFSIKTLIDGFQRVNKIHYLYLNLFQTLSAETNSEFKTVSKGRLAELWASMSKKFQIKFVIHSNLFLIAHVCALKRS